ncbi:MAG: TIGR03752 family integrating conjugative element protein [Gammaproteobacteria bacterium]|nr:TIGR03752 family integrating conjugative element protein [Gammaproteobacteria bacterium]
MKQLPIRKVAYLIGIGFLALLAIVLAAPWRSVEPVARTKMNELPHTPEPDADSPADTIKTLTARLSSLVQEIDQLASSNEALRTQNEELHAKTDLIEARMTTQLQADLQRSQQAQAELAAKLNRALERLDAQQQDGAFQPTNPAYSAYGDTFNAWRWVEPMEAEFLASELLTNSPEDQPRYTIPQNATLVNSTAMTALIGRVPVENRVTDPLPFKVITGADNLAANGITIDGLEGSIWSGFVVGDWALACVTGTLTSVTFVFDDGRIRSLGANTQGAQRIGWISDEKGLPCITGERKTNVRSWLLAQLGVNATGSVADAIANANTTIQQSPTGFKEAFVSGDFREFVAGKATAATGQSLTDWLTTRASHEFDAIFVPTGQTVAIHVDRPLHIDYELGGRKLSYETTR